MGNQSCCCMKGSPSKELFVTKSESSDHQKGAYFDPIDIGDGDDDSNNNLILKLQHKILEEREINSFYDEDLLYQLYDLIITNQTNKLQKFIYEKEIDLTQVFWKVGRIKYYHLILSFPLSFFLSFSIFNC